MIDLKGFKGFFIHNDMMSDIEGRRLYTYCITKNIDCIKSKEYVTDYVPWCGVDFAIKILGYNPKPDYYPDFCKDYLYRKVWNENNWILGKNLFVKPADKYKRFTGFVTSGTYKKKKKGELIWSELINFKNEWRYYITGGEVKASGWYWGDQENTPDAPELKIDIPKDYSGALDFGKTTDGKFALVEAQHPFSCGWYGDKKDDEKYFQWLIDGWNYMQKNY